MAGFLIGIGLRWQAARAAAGALLREDGGALLLEDGGALQAEG